MALGLPALKPDGVAGGFTGGLRAMCFTHYGKSWLKPIIARRLCKDMTIWYTDLHKKVSSNYDRRQQSPTEQDWAWLLPGRDSTPYFDFDSCSVDYISVDILTEWLKFKIATLQNILPKILPGNQNFRKTSTIIGIWIYHAFCDTGDLLSTGKHLR